MTNPEAGCKRKRRHACAWRGVQRARAYQSAVILKQTEVLERLAVSFARKPAQPRKRNVTQALRAYAAFATSAARGAVRVVP